MTDGEKKRIEGKVFVVGANVDTDVIIPARYLTTMDQALLAPHAMEDLDPKQYPIPFLGTDKTSPYRIIVAGTNFGCGSSREHAPIALHGAGVLAVVAKTFARIFYRNAVNGGLILPLESVDDLAGAFKTGDEAVIELYGETPTLTHNGQAYALRPLGPARQIIDAGGLTAYNKRKLGLP